MFPQMRLSFVPGLRGQTQKRVYSSPVEANHNLPINPCLRHAHLSRPADHISGGCRVAADIHIAEDDLVLLQISLQPCAPGAGWRREDHYRMLATARLLTSRLARSGSQQSIERADIPLLWAHTNQRVD